MALRTSNRASKHRPHGAKPNSGHRRRRVGNRAMPPPSQVLDRASRAAGATQRRRATRHHHRARSSRRVRKPQLDTVLTRHRLACRIGEVSRIRRDVRASGARIGGHRYPPTLGADVKVTVMEKQPTAKPDCAAPGNAPRLPLHRPVRISRALGAPVARAVGYGLRREHYGDPPVDRGHPFVAGGRAGDADLEAQGTPPREL